MNHGVEFTRRAERDLRQIADRAVRRRILARVSGLAADARPPDAVRLTGYKDIWRLRVGDWRVCYQVRDHVLLVLIVVVGRRGDVYERLTRRLR
ncbi:MAG: type II toxin-antitoxin system mRNA interferase toxin, RelE/StbE family [Acidobacteria bacterium]|nr:type II toxin-antitoxin system mRNA interferase toxin, RelE/StbE family [Acidobacteriota bacterium]